MKLNFIYEILLPADQICATCKQLKEPCAEKICKMKDGTKQCSIFPCFWGILATLF
jgi:hypothetical protein